MQGLQVRPPIIWHQPYLDAVGRPADTCPQTGNYYRAYSRCADGYCDTFSPAVPRGE